MLVVFSISASYGVNMPNLPEEERVAIAARFLANMVLQCSPVKSPVNAAAGKYLGVVAGKGVEKLGKVNSSNVQILKPLAKGSTGRVIPKNLTEKLVSENDRHDICVLCLVIICDLIA